jgi:hypothetical protein
MTQPGYRHRILVVDRSGSISNVLTGQQSGLEEFFMSESRVPGKATYSLWDFDSEIRCVHSFASLEDVRGYRIEPRDMTALYDAAGDAVETEGRQLAAVPEDQRPEDVVVIISSDGQENSSRRRTGGEVKKLLELQQDTYKWRVLYLGFGAAAFAEGAKIGTRPGLTVNSVNSDTGAQNAWQMSSDYLARVPVASAAAAAGQPADLTDEERALGESGEKQEEQGTTKKKR